MKVLEVTPFYKPSWESGGVTRVAYEVSKHLSDRGHEVTVYTTNMARYPTGVVVNTPVYTEGIKVYYFENVRKYFSKLNFAFLIPYYLPIVARKEIKKFDIIHIHDHRTLLAVVVSYYAKKYDVPYILQAHGSLSYAVGNGYFKKVFDTIWGKNMIRNASQFVALNEDEALQYMEFGITKNKVVIIPNGIDISKYLPLPARGIFRKKYGIMDNSKLILYLGRITKSKGIDVLLQAFLELNNSDSNITLVLAGPLIDYDENTILKYSHNNIIITGFISSEDKMAAFIDADVFVTPSFTGFPMTFLESCICGTPIVTTNKGDSLDWINNTVGYTVEYDSHKIAAAISALLEDDLLRESMEKNCKDLISSEFDISKIIIKIENLYVAMGTKGTI